MKKVTIGSKPAGNRPATPDEWVGAGNHQTEQPRPAPIEPMKRLTIDVSLSLHTRIKTQCALQRVQMADVIRDLLEEQFPA